VTLALLALAFAAEPVETAKRSAESETIAQVRHDLLGERILPIYEYVRFDSQTGNTQIVGYLGLEAISGIDRAGDFDIYALFARRRAGQGEWMIGRQAATTMRRRQTFDGARYWWRPSPNVTFDVWGGVARHQDLDDFRDGIGIARGAVSGSVGPLDLRAGAQVEAIALGRDRLAGDEPFLLRQDAEVRLVLGQGSPLVIEALGALAEPGPVVEWARLEVTAPTIGPLELSVHAQRRQATDWSSVFADRILIDLVGGPVDQIGSTLRVHDVDWSRFAVSYHLVHYDQLGGARWGHHVDVRYVDGLASAVRVTPIYTFRSGPGGVVHSASSVVTWRVDDATRLLGRVAVVPYRKGHQPWALAADVGVEASRDLTAGTSLRLMADLARDSFFKSDLRVGAALTVALR
jgi:hypothetical protein